MTFTNFTIQQTKGEHSMKRILNFMLVVLVLAGLAVHGYAQGNAPTTTTLSAAVTDRATSLTVASATGISASTATVEYLIYVDHELMRVIGLSSTTLTVQRGIGTPATAHKSGSYVIFGAANQATTGTVVGGPFVQSSPTGSCTRASYPTLPLINTVTGEWHNCNNGTWLEQTNIADVPNTPLVAVCSVPIGSVAYGSVGTNTTDIANKRMTTSIFVPYTYFATGISILQGGTATTDNITGQLADGGGKVFAPGAAAGVLLATADTFKNLPFATAQIVTGPAVYMASIVGNGTAAGAYRTVATATHKNIVSQGTTSITFGTFPDFTPPTTFTADLAPHVCIY
jgi:hypothetical protein